MLQSDDSSPSPAPPGGSAVVPQARSSSHKLTMELTPEGKLKIDAPFEDEMLSDFMLKKLTEVYSNVRKPPLLAGRIPQLWSYFVEVVEGGNAQSVMTSLSKRGLEGWECCGMHGFSFTAPQMDDKGTIRNQKTSGLMIAFKMPKMNQEAPKVEGGGK